MRKIRIQFSEEGSRIPLINFSMENGDTHTALVDTGSESTLFDQELKADESFVVTPTDYKMSLIGLSGETEERRVMSAKAYMTINDMCGLENIIEAEGILADLSSVTESIMERYGKHLNVTAVLGSDFLKEYGAKINYRKRTLTLRR